jgi:acyl-CoA thioesterase
MLDAFRTVVSTCGSFSVTVGGLSLAVTATTVTFPQIGDQTAALQINVQVLADGVIVSGDVVAIRYGGTVIVVTNVAYPALSQGLTESVAAAAYAKVASQW